MRPGCPPAVLHFTGRRTPFIQVHAPDADMDLLCLAPRHATRLDFFDASSPWGLQVVHQLNCLEWHFLSFPFALIALL